MNNTDKVNTKDKIRELSLKIKQSSGDLFEDWEWAPYEWEIAEIIIDYSIRHNIIIPLINYDLYNKVRKESIEDGDNTKPIKRKKIDDPANDENDSEKEYLYRENHIFFDDFAEAIGEECFTNPRFTIHPDIKELVECWNVE